MRTTPRPQPPSGTNGGGIPSWPRSYVAIGDSNCAGLEADSFVPWPERLRATLLDSNDEMEFHNLGLVGAFTADVAAEQVPRAIELRPDLVTVCCGANDALLAVSPDIPAAERALRELMSGLVEGVPDAMVVVMTYGNFTAFMPFRPRSRERVRRALMAINDLIREVADDTGCLCADVNAASGSNRPEYYGVDGIHGSDLGHELMAQVVAGVIEREAGLPATSVHAELAAGGAR